MMVVRTISGFTKETRNSDPKYENCNRSANEFGRVSSLCRQVRVALYGILPTQNNLVVVNGFTKKMREVLTCDTTNPKGDRQLANALATPEGRQLLEGYGFNPDTTIALDYTLANNLLTIKPGNIIYPTGINHIGFRVHELAFDFATAESKLVSGDWVFGSGTINLAVPNLSNATGVLFTLLEAQFYDYANGGYLPMANDRGKKVAVVEVG